MRVYIPTVGRPQHQRTADALAAAGVSFKLVVPTGQRAEYTHPAVECKAHGIRATRQWILDSAMGKVVMLDDDLTIYARHADNRWPVAKPADVAALFGALEGKLDKYAHGGVCDKFMSQARPMHTQENKRYIHILAYNIRLFPKRLHYRTETGEDHDMNLQLLKAGCANFLLTQWAHADKPWAVGGCSTWRTKALNIAASEKLAALHADVIELRAPTKSMASHGDVPFTMRISWRKAAKAGGVL